MKIDKVVVMAEACNYYIGIIDVEIWRNGKYKTYKEVGSDSIKRLMIATRTPKKTTWSGGAYHLRMSIIPFAN